ncbi:MAG: glycosyltransferase family 2 protein [Planctomycetota bacterium]
MSLKSKEFVAGFEDCEVSVVMPVFNEAESLLSTVREVIDVLNSGTWTWEVLLVDDGSTDESADVIHGLNEFDTRVKGVGFRSNFGQTAAMSAGIAYARGGIIVTMDADGQNDPAEIPRMLDVLSEDNDLVVGWRKQRRDTWSRRIPSRVANWLISRSTRVALHDYGCSLKAFRSESIKDVMLIGEMHRMIPILVRSNGGRIKELPVNHRPRTAGVSIYGLSRMPLVVADLIVARFILASATKPMYFFGKFALVGLLTSLLSAGTATYFKLANLKDFIETPLPLLAVFSMMFASLSLLSGLLAELLVRVMYSQSGPPYKIRWTLGF